MLEVEGALFLAMLGVVVAMMTCEARAPHLTPRRLLLSIPGGP